MEPVKKPTGFSSNSWAIMRELNRLCHDKSHVHVPLMGGRAAGAQVYPGKLCEAICRGLARQKDYDGKGLVCTIGLSKSQTSDIILAMMKEIEAIRSEDSTGDHLCTIGSSGVLPTTADEEGGTVVKDEQAYGAGPDPKPTAVKDNSWLETKIEKPEIERPKG